MADLRTDYMDDILSAAMGGQRQYKLTFPDGTTQIVKIEDVSEYDQVGSTFGAGDINKTNQEVNLKLNSEDVVDHNLVTKSGFAADALEVKKQFSEQNKKIPDTTWKVLTETTGNNEASFVIPGYASEIAIELSFPYQSLTQEYVQVIPVNYIYEDEREYAVGSWNVGRYYSFHLTLKSFNLIATKYDNSDMTSVTNTKILWR